MSKLPEIVSTIEPLEIEQGWLPGARIIERLRWVRSRSEERWHRTIKFGSGLARIEVEEETAKQVFESLWPLTLGQRVHKFRYPLADHGLTWDIDVFAGRALTLAEVELLSEITQIDLPAWLRPCNALQKSICELHNASQYCYPCLRTPVTHVSGLYRKRGIEGDLLRSHKARLQCL